MGYYTRYKLGTEIDGGSVVDHENGISALAGYGNLFNDETYKWYDHEENMRQYSTIYPKTLFILEGEGEKPGDLWVEYYKNGRRQLCKGVITYDPYDESKLK